MNYWEKEIPKRVITSRNELEYYPRAMNLCVITPDWTDYKGEEHKRRLIVFSVWSLLEGDANALSAAREVFDSILRSIDERLERIG